jgi:hypothetical protein
MYSEGGLNSMPANHRSNSAPNAHQKSNSKGDPAALTKLLADRLGISVVNRKLPRISLACPGIRPKQLIREAKGEHRMHDLRAVETNGKRRQSKPLR